MTVRFRQMCSIDLGRTASEGPKERVLISKARLGGRGDGRNGFWEIWLHNCSRM
jgi:hypothetical protein